MKIVPVILRARTGARLLAGEARVREQSRRAREALDRSALATGAQLDALDKDTEDAPIPSNGWHWSLSHARELAAAVVSRERIGIDVERVRPRRPGLTAKVTTHDELDLIGGFSWSAFFRVWTAKEAVLKKAGCGLLELSQCALVAVPGGDTLVIAHRGRDHFVHQREQDGHWLALAHDGPSDAEVAWRFDEDVA